MPARASTSHFSRWWAFERGVDRWASVGALALGLVATLVLLIL